MDIKVKYLRDIPHLERIKGGDWIDLRAGKDMDFMPGEYKRIPLGVAIELPVGFEAIVAPRSSTYQRYGIMCAGSIGIIDEAYRGDNDEWMFPAYSPHGGKIQKGDRIAQFRLIEHHPRFDIVEVDHLGNPGRGGIGSTGRQ